MRSVHLPGRGATVRLRLLTAVMIGGGVWSMPATASAQLLLRDDFDGSGIIDPTVWRLPFGTEGTFVGRTQFRGDPATDMPMQGIAEASASDGLVTELDLDTYSPIDPGNQFLGTDILTKRNFARGGGLTFEARMRLAPASPGGLVGAFFSYDVTRDTTGTGDLVRDEIDLELLSNQTTGAATQDPASNYWDEGPFTGAGAAGDLQFHDVAGLDLTQFQTYRMEWTPDHIKWYVNDQLVRTSTTDIPDDPQKIHFNLWAPDSDFADAFNAALTPTAVEGSNQTYKLQVDHVEINRIDTTLSANLLTNPSFEDGTNGWTLFNNAFVSENTVEDPLPVVTGDFMLKTYGPFFGIPDASGALQSVPAAPGEEFEAHVLVQSNTTVNFGLDPIAGTENFGSIKLEFLDSLGNLLTEAFDNDTRNTNVQETPILDGRDPNIVQDEFVMGIVNAVAPPGTASVQLVLPFVQINNEGGALYWDDAFLGKLTVGAPAVPGDADGDGDVDLDDYNIMSGNMYTATGNGASDGDFNDDGFVDFEDFVIQALNFGDWPAAEETVGSLVPEPTTLTLIGAAGLVLLRRRKH